MTESTQSATPSAESFEPPVVDDLNAEIQRTASRAARDCRPQATAGAPDVPPPAVRARRQRRLLLTFGLLAAAFTILNLSGLGFYRAPRAAPMSQRELEAYLREMLYFQVQDIEIFHQEQGRIPILLEEMAGSREEGVTYTNLGGDRYRVAVEDSGRSLAYESGMDQAHIFAEWADD
jgi:hypothetical protein